MLYFMVDPLHNLHHILMIYMGNIIGGDPSTPRTLFFKKVLLLLTFSKKFMSTLKVSFSASIEIIQKTQTFCLQNLSLYVEETETFRWNA